MNALIIATIPLLSLAILLRSASTMPIKQIPEDGVSDGTACQLLLNELNVDQPGQSSNKQFIELKFYCPPRPRRRPSKLKGYRIIIVRGNNPAVIFYLDLKDFKVDEKKEGDRYFVIAASLILPVDILLSNPIIENINTDGALPLGDDSPYGVILLYSDSARVFESLKLRRNEQGQFVENLLGRDDIALIRKYSKDMVVYGRKTVTNRCSVFEKVWPDISIMNPDKLYLLRDMDSDTNINSDLSLNRCTSSVDGFKPESFKYGSLTPGAENDCSGSMFFLEDIIDQVAPLTSQELSPTSLTAECESDRDNIPPSRYASVSNLEYVETVHEQLEMVEQSCLRNIEGGLGFAEMEMELDNNNRLIQRMGSAPIVPSYDSNVFDPDWIIACQSSLPYNAEILKQKDVQKWLNVKIDDQQKCSFRCVFCVDYLEKGFRPDIKRKTSIATQAGISSNFPRVNQKAILDHPKESLHLASMQFQRQLSLARTQEEYNRIMKLKNEEENKMYLPTLRVLVAVYAEAISGATFRSHKIIMELGKFWEVNLGFHHHTSNGAQLMLVTISETFHSTLINALVEQDKPFSFLVDTSTDVTNIAYMISYIQTIEYGQPIIYLYRLIELSHGERAQDMFLSLKEVIDIDTQKINSGFREYFKRKMISYSSDGASVMLGPGESLQTYVQNFVGRKVTGIHCMAHKIQLSLLHALYKSKDKKFDYFKQFEKSINSFYNFYSSRGAKRWLHLSDIAQDLGLTINRIKYFFEARWAASQYSALKNIWKDYEALRIDLTAIAIDTTFTSKARNTAMELHNKLSDKTYVIVLLEIIDVLNVYQTVSKVLQGEAGLLAGKGYIIAEAVKEFEKLESNYGAELKNFLSQCSCPDVCEEGTCTLEQYDACEDIHYKEMHLGYTELPVTTFKLSEVRTELYNEIIKEIKKYFNMELLNAFDIFNNKRYKLPQCPAPPQVLYISRRFLRHTGLSNNTHKFSNYDTHSDVTIINDDKESMATICQFYLITKEECQLLTEEWNVLKSAVLTNEAYLVEIKSDLGIFWPTALKNRDGNLPWTELTKKIIELILTTPFGTSDCERGFSVVTKTKSDETNRLTPTTLEHLVRVKVNGPQSLTKFNAKKYTREFLKKHVRVDDDQFLGGRLPKPIDRKKYFPNSVLF